MLKVMGGDAPRVATAVVFRFVRLSVTASVGDVVLHAQQAIGVMMMGDDWHRQHQHADHKQKVGDKAERLHGERRD